MRFCIMSILFLALAMYWASINFAGQSSDAVDAHVAAARQAAGQEHVALFETVCMPATTPLPAADPPANRSSWYAEPVKVFDNLYFCPASNDFISVLYGCNAADVHADGSVKLKCATTCRRFRTAEHHTNLLANLIDEDQAGFRF